MDYNKKFLNVLYGVLSRNWNKGNSYTLWVGSRRWYNCFQKQFGTLMKLEICISDNQ